PPERRRAGAARAGGAPCPSAAPDRPAERRGSADRRGSAGERRVVVGAGELGSRPAGRRGTERLEPGGRQHRGTGGDRAPRIIDPLSLATDLAHTRYEYVTGHGTDAVAAPGSPAEEADEQVRRAYQGTVVEGGQPEVLAAHV